METLTIKELAPYLPYGLKCYSTTIVFEPNDSRIYEMGLISMRGVLKGAGIPLLRPLSDLRTLGVDSIPINEHTINMLIHEKHNLDYGLFCIYKNEISIELEGDSFKRYDAHKSISFNVILDIQEELLKGHYDIFNLIGRKLAIDLNTIKETE